jgi:hypothetical protein
VWKAAIRDAELRYDKKGEGVAYYVIEVIRSGTWIFNVME